MGQSSEEYEIPNLRPDSSVFGDVDKKGKEWQVERHKQNTRHRNKLVVWMMVVCSVWLAAILIMIMVKAFTTGLSDKVMITVLATTTANVLGLAFIILRGLFESSE